MNHAFVLQRPTGTGGEDYDDVDTFWGEVQLTKAGSEGTSEGTSSGAMIAYAPWRIRTYYRTDVRAEQRIFEQETGRVFQIASYGDPDGLRAELHIFCSEVQ